MELSNQYIISVVLYLLLVSQSLVMLVDFICAGMRRRIIMEQIVDDLKVTQNVWSGVNGVNCGCFLHCSVCKPIARNVGVSWHPFYEDG